MSFNTTKRKAVKINQDQNKIDNLLFKKENKKLSLRSNGHFKNKVVTLIDSEFFPFQTERVFGSLVSIATNMNIYGTAEFTGQISIPDFLVPYIKAKIIIKKPINGKLVGVSVKEFYTYDNIPNTTITLEPNKTIFEEVAPGELIIIGNTGSTGIVTSVVNGLVPILDQRNVDNENVNYPLEWEKIGDNSWEYWIGSQVMLEVFSEENVGISHTEGNIIYNPNVFPPGHPNEGQVESYTRVDERTPVLYDAFRAITYDIEAKILLFVDTRNIENKKTRYTI